MADDIAPSEPKWLGVFRGRSKKATSALMILRLWKRPDPAYIRIAILAGVVFVLDTVIDLEIVVPVLYVNVILLAMRSGRARDVAVAGWASIALTIVSFLLTVQPTAHFATTLINNGLSLLAIICVMVLSLRNVSAQNEIVRARDRVALVSRGATLRTISASVVHEVTQPLTAIGANAQAAYRWLSQSPPNLDETKTAARRIVVEVERASHVIGRLRRSMAAGEISTEICDVRTLIEGSLEHVRLEMDEAQIDVTALCAPDVTIAADRILIEQVLINALSNAIDSLRGVDFDRRSIAIEASALPGAVKIDVRDSGVGADAEMLDQMFDPFFTTKPGSGMGIGLAVSRSIIDAHGGTIRAYSNKPRGLVLEVTIPAKGSCI